MHILKAYDEIYSKIIREHKYKDKDNDKDKDKDKDKDTEKVPETPNSCYIFEILMTHSFQIWWYLTVILFKPVTQVIESVLQGWVYHRYGIFLS